MTDTPLCELCCEETEDVKHFLLIYPTLNDIREEHLFFSHADSSKVSLLFVQCQYGFFLSE
jgi:hypothetical protein